MGTDPSGLTVRVSHITRPEAVVQIIQNGFEVGEAGLVWFRGANSGPAGPPHWARQRPSVLNIVLRWNPPILSREVLTAAERAADALEPNRNTARWWRLK